MAYSNRFLPIPDVRFGSNSDTHSDSNANTHSDTNTYADTGAKRSIQPER